MKYLILFFLLTISANSQGQSGPDHTVDLGCLEEQWAQINPSEEDKNFDIENDFDKQGNRISCKNYITPSELNRYFIALKTAVKNKNKEDVADLIRFPIITKLDGMVDVSEGARAKVNSKKIQNSVEFIEQYDEIMLPTTIKIIQCMQLNNMMSIPIYGIGTDLGELWFEHAYGTRETLMISISSSPETDKHWLEKECSW